MNYFYEFIYIYISYLFKLGLYELIDRNDKIQFLYQAKQVKFEDKTLLKDYFRNDYNPVILVIDTNNLLKNNKGLKMNVIFENTILGKINLVVDYGTTINEMLELYLRRIERPDLIGKDNKITFICNGSRVNFGDYTKVEDYQDQALIKLHPTIIVNFVYSK